MNSEQPIGFFDSGVGGTSIWKEVITLLPQEDTIYLADSSNAPYGEKPIDKIIQLCRKNVDLLLENHCKLIVVACNTATTNAIKVLREEYNVPFIGIEPAIKPAALNSRSRSIGILATKGTLSSELFSKTSGLYSGNTQIVEVVGKGLVPLIESGKLDSPEMTELLLELLKPMLEAEIDYLVLGCSHFPYLIPVLKKILPESVKIIDSGEAVARQTKKILQDNNLINNQPSPGKHILYTNTKPKVLRDLTKNASEEKQIKISHLDF